MTSFRADTDACVAVVCRGWGQEVTTDMGYCVLPDVVRAVLTDVSN